MKSDSAPPGLTAALSAEGSGGRAAPDRRQTLPSPARPAYFVVARRHGIEGSAVYWDELPRAPIRGRVYVVRLDQLPNGHDMVRASTSQLYAVYCRLRDRGKLPPRWEPPPKPKAAAAERLVGHRENFARTWDSDRPGMPYPRPEDIERKPEAPAALWDEVSDA